MPQIGGVFESTFLLAFVAGVFVLAGLVKGVVGLGLPTIAMGLLSLGMAPAQAAALLLLPSLATNLWQMLAGPDLPGLLRRLWPMLLAALVGTTASAGWLTTGGQAAVIGLGLALMLYAALALGAPQLAVPRRWESWLAPVVGLATGLATGATGVFVVPAVFYLQALQLDRDRLVQALGLSFTVSTLALGLGLAQASALSGTILLQSLAALLPAALGMALGQGLRHRLPAAAFRLVFLIALAVLGLYLTLR